MNIKKFHFLNFPLGIKKLLIFLVIGVFLLSGCEQIKKFYGIETPGEEEYIPIEEIKVKEEVPQAEVPPEVIEKNVSEEIKEVKEEREEKKIKEGAKVVIVKEMDLVSLRPKALDPDKDKVTFTYTSPIGADGKWQTRYGDAGEYTITITASDGQSSVTKDVLIIVNKKEETPTIDEAIPKEGSLEAKENSKIDFSVKASDLNKDQLTYLWKLDGDNTSKNKSYTYNIGYEAAGQHTVKVIVSDGTKETSKTWALKVSNVNRKPILDKIADIKVKETETIIIVPKATDPDNDRLTFSISDKFKKIGDKFEWATTYEDSGEYEVTVSVSDDVDEVSQKLKVTVENVNRAPVIEDIVLG